MISRVEERNRTLHCSCIIDEEYFPNLSFIEMKMYFPKVSSVLCFQTGNTIFTI